MTYFNDFNLKVLILKHESKFDLKCKYYLSDMLIIFYTYKSKDNGWLIFLLLATYRFIPKKTKNLKQNHFIIRHILF